MPALDDVSRLILSIVSGALGIIIAILTNYLLTNLGYYIRKIIPGEPKQGHLPVKKSSLLWSVYLISIIIFVITSAIAIAAPRSSDIEYEKIQDNTPLIERENEAITETAPSQIIVPTSVPNNYVLNSIEVYKTGINGNLCGYAKQHTILRDENDFIHIFYSPRNETTIVYEVISKDEGKTWSAPQFISGFDVSERVIGFGCSAAQSNVGIIHLVFGIAASDIAYTRWKFREKWRTPVIRAQGIPDIGTFSPDIATGPENQVHIVWSSKKIWYTFFDGKAWSGERDVSPGGWHPDIFIDKDGGRHIVYNGGGEIPDKSGSGLSPVTVYYSFSDNGQEWKEEVTIPRREGIWAGDAAIVVDSRGRRHVTYKRWAPLEGDLCYSYSDDGVAWSMPFQLNDEPGVQTGSTGNESAAMVIDSSDNLYVIWKGLRGDGDVKKWYLLLKWLNAYEGVWSNAYVIAPLCENVGCHPSLQYGIVKPRTNGQMFIDITWTDDSLFYGKIVFNTLH